MNAPQARWRARLALVFVVPLLAMAALGASPSGAAAQYFGRNAVRYKSFNFKVLHTRHFDIYYYPADAGSVKYAARMAERWYARLSRMFGQKLQGRQPFILYASQPDFDQTTAVSGQMGTGTGGVTEQLKRRVILPMAGPLMESNHVIGHELTHAFQYNVMGIVPNSPRLGNGGAQLPLWMIEGMAEYFSLGPRSPLTAMWLRDALAHPVVSKKDTLPSISQIANSQKYFPYRWGQALWAYIGGRFGDAAVVRIYRSALRSGPRRAIRHVLGVSADTLSKQWHAAIRRAYEPLLASTQRAKEFGTPLFKKNSALSTTMDVSPSLSPDGKRLMFLSSRDLFSIDLFLADPTTGKVIKRITQTATDAHLQTLEFINSAGAWSPDGKRFAFAALSKEQPVLDIIAVPSGKLVKELRFPSLEQIFSPTWSPDGRRIAFSANDGGLQDMFMADVKSGRLHRLTHDAYAELQPAWSPDGRRIAFVTDRYGAKLSELQMGPYRLALMDVASHRITPVHTFDHGKSINPQWSPDGHSLYFIGDPQGISNIYRVALSGAGASVASGGADPAPRAYTNVLGGVSGITELSPALSVASRSGRIVFDAFVKGGNRLYRMNDPHRAMLAVRPDTGAAATAALTAASADTAATALAARTVISPVREPLKGDSAAPPLAAIRPVTVTAPSAAMLPPQHRKSRLLALLDDPTLGLPDSTSFPHNQYAGGLKLDYVAPPQLGAGISSFGSYIGAGTMLHFSDMLGEHDLTTTLQANIIDGNVVDGLGALAQYMNMTHRLSWGFIAGQVPYFMQAYNQALVSYGSSNTPALLQNDLRIWQVDRRAIGLFSYPFSSVLRVDFGAGFDQQSYKMQEVEQLFSASTGQQITQKKITPPSCGDSLNFYLSFCQPGALNQALATGALVFDNSLSGPLGPIMGQRYRLELDPTTGSVTYLGALLDYRRYFMPIQPLTIAGRLMTYGRYGGGAADPRLGELFIGYPSLLRGYRYGSFNFNNCPTSQSVQQCNSYGVFSRLFGTRMAVANLELRLPLLGPLGLIAQNFLPAELIGFFDAGDAWTAQSRASFLGGPRQPLTSVGGGVRIDLFGFTTAEVDWVDPLSRNRGGFITFSLMPAF